MNFIVHRERVAEGISCGVEPLHFQSRGGGEAKWRVADCGYWRGVLAVEGEASGAFGSWGQRNGHGYCTTELLITRDPWAFCAHAELVDQSIQKAVGGLETVGEFFVSGARMRIPDALAHGGETASQAW